MRACIWVCRVAICLPCGSLFSFVAVCFPLWQSDCLCGSPPLPSVLFYLLVVSGGFKGRRIARTDMNAVSSRSHSVFTITVAKQGQQKCVGPFPCVDQPG